MRFWTVHLREGAEPVLVPERFSWGAFFFGWIWLVLHRAWIPAILFFAATVVIAILPPPPLEAILFFALAVIQGLYGQDLRRWSLERRGYFLAHVVSAPNEEGAITRLLQRRPQLAESMAP